HARCSAAGAPGWPRVERAPRRDRPDPRLVLQRPGTARPRRHAGRPGRPGGRPAAAHPAGIPRLRQRAGTYFYQAGRIMAFVRFSDRWGVTKGRGGRMSEQALDLRKSLQTVRRYKYLVGALAVVGLIGGVGYAEVHPAMLSSTAQVILPSSASR